jgi:hypothetical protein
MTEFRADCTINVHIEARGNPAKFAWSCSILYGKRGRVVIARGFLGKSGREEAELAALAFGIGQALRLKQEKVDLAGTFALEGILDAEKPSGRGASESVRLKKRELISVWQGFRLRRVATIRPEEANLLREEAGKAFGRKRKMEDE